MKRFLPILAFVLFLSACSKPENEITLNTGKVRIGADILVSEKIDLLKNRNIAIATNQTGRLSNGTSIVDTLWNLGINIIALFGPEHGIRGGAQAGEIILDGKDDKTGIPIYSLYGKNRKPTAEMLKNVDLILFDIQDIGARFYTYISTMYYLLETAAENNIEIIILDRPNPLSGNYVNGPVLNKDHISFVGIAPIPIAHGMTVGELAKYFTGEKLFNNADKLNLKVIECKNLRREQYFNETGLKWIKPSPNIPDFETALVYPGLCLLEATNVSEGRGTDKPFLKFGAPYINSVDLQKYLELSEIEGVKFIQTSFTPVSIKGVAEHPKYENELCQGIEIQITDPKVFDPINLGITLIYELKRLYPAYFKINENWMSKLYGSDSLYIALEEGKTPIQIINSWDKKLEEFKKIRQKYLLYN